MRRNRQRVSGAVIPTCVAVLLSMLGNARAEIIDRIAVIVGDHLIKHSDILNEIRVTAFLNQEKSDFSPAEEKKAVNRLIDQALIRRDIESGAYVEPDPAEADKLLQQIKARYGSDAAYRKALAGLGITEAGLRERLEWQTEVLKFVEARFGANQAGQEVNQQFFSWLDETRKQTRVVFKEESLK